MISQQSQRVAAKSSTILAVFLASWSGLDTQILADPSGVLSINNSKLGIKTFSVVL